MKRTLFWFAAVSLLVFPCCVPAAEVKVSDATQACIECHTVIHPGIVTGLAEEPPFPSDAQGGHGGQGARAESLEHGRA